MKYIFPIEEANEEKYGGKVRGLALLKQYGKRIPATWVVTTDDPEVLKPFIASLPPGKTWAVRSSAAGEDSAEASFAGQYETFLHVKGTEQIYKSVIQCFRSEKSLRVASYRKKTKSGYKGMSVIIQEMVIPAASGVLFTVDPVNNRHDKISLSVVTGSAEQLMSGTREGETMIFYKQRWQEQECKFIPPEKFRQLIREALETEAAFGQPADLEWALDEKGTLYWLQLRPVTGLSSVHLNELDNTPRYTNPVYTRGNIGEMMPGPVTPLTLSTFVKAIDAGLQIFYKKSGVFQKLSGDYVFIHSFYNHLFFDVRALYEMPKKVWLTARENIDFSVVGKLIPDMDVSPEAPLWKRMINFAKVTFYMLNGPRALKQLKKLEARFRLDCPGDPIGCYRLISENMQVLMDAWDLHYVSSSQSGGYFSSVMNIFSGGPPPRTSDYEKAAGLFTDIPGIESAQVLQATDELATLLAQTPRIREFFLGVPVDDAFRYLSDEAPQPVRERWKALLQRHGHRCVREAELREKEWALDPAPVIEGIRGKTAFLLENRIPPPRKQEKNDYDFNQDNKLSRLKKWLVRWLLPKARVSVARREQTKALAILVQHRFKLAYRHLAGLMVNKSFLADPDLIYFLTHEETGQLLHGHEIAKWNHIAKTRRNLYGTMQQLSFPDLIFGIPVPGENDNTTSGAGDLTGIPVSRGIVEGRVRLVHSMKEARMLRTGEIMVSKYTDIGWTPFYSIIKGMITEIGSPLSHGAVVAREYNLPTLVSVKGAMNKLKDGQFIRLDAIKGKVEILN